MKAKKPGHVPYFHRHLRQIFSQKKTSEKMPFLQNFYANAVLVKSANTWFQKTTRAGSYSVRLKKLGPGIS